MAGALGISIGRDIGSELAVLSQHLAMGDDHFDRQRRKIGGQNEICAPSRCDRSQFALEAEMLGGVEGRHLEGGNRFEALRDRMADDPVYMAFMYQRAGMAVIGAQN